MRSVRRLAAVTPIAVAAAVWSGPAGAGTPAPSDPEPATPIEHVIALMQENHTFDNYFGTYPGADGFSDDTCVPVDPSQPRGECVEPFALGGQPIVDLGHNDDVFFDQWRFGEMDGFVSAFADRQPGAGRQALGFYDDRDLPYYWNLADEYVLFDRFFTSAAGGSVRNHFYWISGSPGNFEEDALRPEGFDDIPTIFDRLQEAGISWKFYVQNYDPEITFRNVPSGSRAGQIIWAPLLNYNRFLDDPELNERIVPLEQYYEDLANDELPAVAYMVPSGASEHPPGSIQAGERFVRGLINALMRSSAWESSAFTWTYDDWGGWYDHVAPPQVDEFGYGFRAPALLVSPYARRGHIDSTELDFTSILKFIEENWGLEPLADRDAAANSLTGAFDFNQEPRDPVLLDRLREPEPLPPARSGVVYVSYGAAVAIAVVAILASWLSSRRRRTVAP